MRRRMGRVRAVSLGRFQVGAGCGLLEGFLLMTGGDIASVWRVVLIEGVDELGECVSWPAHGLPLLPL